jgi:hypothetical protein
LVGAITVAIAHPRGGAAVAITRAIIQSAFRASFQVITVAIVIAIACQVTAPFLVNAITVSIAHPRGSTAVFISAVLDFIFGTVASAVAIVVTIAGQVTTILLVNTITVAIA